MTDIDTSYRTTDVPEKIWATTGLYYDYVEDWSEGAWQAEKDNVLPSANDDTVVEYIRTDILQAVLKREAETVARYDARSAALEARVAAADALAAWARAISERKSSPVTGGRLVLERYVVGLETALAAYEATKEPRAKVLALIDRTAEEEA